MVCVFVEIVFILNVWDCQIEEGFCVSYVWFKVFDVDWGDWLMEIEISFIGGCDGFYQVMVFEIGWFYV